MGNAWVNVAVQRFAENPLIRPEMLPGGDGANINGPCMLRVPEWVERPLGKYYLYFAHHGGGYIRMARADDLHGPWTVHPGGVLGLDDLAFEAHHIASPEILVDDAARTIRLYFHVAPKSAERVTSGPHRDADWPGQTSHVALSADGLSFEPRADVLASSYLRVFRHKGNIYGIAMRGDHAALARSDDGLRTFERGAPFMPRSRHWALLRRGNHLWAFFTRIGDAPEQILLTRLDLTGDWDAWPRAAPPPVPVLEPEADYEGARLPVEPSRPSAATGVNQVRDPYVYEEDGRLTLFYSVAGESGIAAAELALAPTCGAAQR